MEQFQIFSAVFRGVDDSSSVLSELATEVNDFVGKTPQVKNVEWLQTYSSTSYCRLTAIVTYTVMRNARAFEG